ncbi:tetratricopeptide repeat protein [Candidatus Woesearchaeota archaeon]|nr:tetratricopeptide repeat protein [Candidatus Woesearchaeota archaeon]
MGKKANAIIGFGGLALAAALAGWYFFQNPVPSNVTHKPKEASSALADITDTLQERIASSRNIAYLALDLEREDNLGVTDEDYQLLDKILDTAKARITVKQTYSKNDAYKILTTIADIIDEFGFEGVVNSDPLNHTLKTKKIDCNEYTLLYLAIAEHLDIPLKGVNAPQHIFVRFVLSDNDYLNWECVSRQQSKELSNELYIKGLNIHPDAIRSGAALKTLDRQQMVGRILTENASAKSKKGDLEGALVYFNQAIKLNPNDANAYNNRGNAKRKKGDLEGALEDYDTAIKLNPNEVNAYYNRGIVKSEKGDLEGARADYDQAIKLNPNDANAYNNRGYAKYKKGDLEGTLADYDQAIKLNPNHANVYYNRGIVKSEKGDLEGALEDYDTAIKLNPNHANAYHNRGYAKGNKGYLEGALEDYDMYKRLTKGK